MEPKTKFSRRGFLKTAGKVAVGASLGAAGLSVAAAAEAPKYQYKAVDVEKVYWNGVYLYYKYACGQGTLQAITQELGEPFSSIPPYMTKWGEGGSVGEGSHCGALVGSSTAIALAFGAEPEVATKLTKELNAWYRKEIGSGSVLCHASVTEWSKANGVKVESQERKDRCARVTGETAKKAALLMNAALKGEFKAELTKNNATATTCMNCHGSSGSGNGTVRAGVPASDCTPCHEAAHKS